MKGAAQAWGVGTAGSGAALPSKPMILRTLAKPRVVLGRPVGSGGCHHEHARLPASLPVDRRRPLKASDETAETDTRRPDEKAARKAAPAFESDRSGARACVWRKKPHGTRGPAARTRNEKAETALEEASVV